PLPDPEVEKRRQDVEKTQQDLYKWLQDIHKWRDEVKSEVLARYSLDLREARVLAAERTRPAANVDFGALRGGGAEFVLEFTAVVVIIFAAVVLGVLDILKQEQIGTLLAAIAGYVLGRATTRGRSPEDKEGAAVKQTQLQK